MSVKMSTKSCLLINETLQVLWLLTLGVCQSQALHNSESSGDRNQPYLNQQRNHASISDLKRPNSTTRVLMRCQVKCQEEFCWNLCGFTAEGGLRHLYKILPRRRRHAATIDVAQDTLPPLLPTSGSSPSSLRSSSTPSPSALSFSTSSGEDSFSGTGMKRSTMRSERLPPPGGAAAVRSGSFLNVNISVRVIPEDSRLSWELSLWWSSVTSLTNRTVRVHYASETCNFYPDFPHCNEPNHHDSHAILVDTNKWMKYVFNEKNTKKTLLYNAKYWVEIEYNKESSMKYYFTTSGCYKTDKNDSRKCIIKEIPKKKKVPTATLR